MQPDPDTPLLSDTDPAPVTVQPGRARLLITCEHAGNAVPVALGDLGVAHADLYDHIGWDPGAWALALRLGRMLDAPVIGQPYSRLVIDCNRPFGAPDLVPGMSDKRAVPGNHGLTKAALKQRWDAIHQPFHKALADMAEQAQALLSVHSFTAQRQGDTTRRAVHIGVLARQANPLARALLKTRSDGPVIANAPYAIEDASDYTIPVHAEPRNLPHALLEVRNDLIADPGGIETVAAALTAQISEFTS